MARDVAKIITLAATGAEPEWDVMVVTDAHHATLWLKKAHQPFDYASLGVDPKVIYYDKGDGTFIIVDHFGINAQTGIVKRLMSLFKPQRGVMGIGHHHHVPFRLCSSGRKRYNLRHVSGHLLRGVVTKLDIDSVLLVEGLAQDTNSLWRPRGGSKKIDGPFLLGRSHQLIYSSGLNPVRRSQKCY